MPKDGFEQWRAALAGGRPPIYEADPWCGYFKMQDRNATVAKGGKWPLVPASIYIDHTGTYVAERDGRSVPVDWVWPYCAMRPITYDEYLEMHKGKQQ